MSPRCGLGVRAALAIWMGALLASASSPALARSGPRAVTVVRAGQLLGRVPLRYRGPSGVGLLAAHSVTLPAPVRRGSFVIVLSNVPRDLEGPLARGSRVGRASLRVGRRVLGSTALVTEDAVSAASLGQRLRDFLSRSLTLAALALLVGCSLMLARLRSRATRRRRGLAERGSGQKTAA